MSRSWWTPIGAAGMLVSSAVAITVGVRTFLNPLNPSRYDAVWAIFYLALAAGIGLTFWIRRGRLLIALTLGCSTLFILITIVRANTAPALLMLVWIILVSAAMGDRVLTMFISPFTMHFFERLLLAISVGLGMLALLTLGLGKLQLYYPTVAYGLLFFLSIMLLPGFVRFVRQPIAERATKLKNEWQVVDLRLPALTVALLVGSMLGAFIWSIAPSIHFDALNYHLGIPAIYIRQHGIGQIAEIAAPLYSHYAEMLYTLGLLLAGQPLPTMIHMTFGLLTTALVFTLGQRLAGTRVGLIGALLFCSMPIVGWESGTAYTDMQVVLYTFATVYCIVAWWIEREDGWLTLAGTLAGFGFGTKMNTALVLAPAALLIAGGLTLRYHFSRRTWLGLVRFGAPALLLASPGLIQQWLSIGNPFFPFSIEIFKSSGLGVAPKSGAASYFQPRPLGVSRLVEFVLLPWRLTVSDGQFSDVPLNGLVGILPLLALPWLYLRSRPRKYLMMLGMLIAATFLLWFEVAPALRYLLIVFPLLALLASLNVETLWNHFAVTGARRWMVVAGCLIVLSYFATTRLVSTVYNWQIPERYPYRLALGLETPEHFLSQSLPVYDAFQFLNRENNDSLRVLSIGNVFRLYTRAKIFSLNTSPATQGFVRSLKPDSNLVDKIKQQGFDFLLMNYSQVNARSDLRSLPISSANLQQFVHLEFARNNVYVYRIGPNRAANMPLKNLVTNGGFEEIDAQSRATDWIAYGEPLIDRTATRSHSGKVAVRVDAQSELYQRIPVKPNQLYTLGHWTRSDLHNQSARLQINWVDDALKIVYVSIDVIPAESAWQWHQMSVTAPQGASQAEIYLSVQGESQVWFDDIWFVQGSIASAP